MSTLPRKAALALVAPGLALASALPAQEKKPAKAEVSPQQQALQAKLDKKLASDFLTKNAKWFTDYDKALAAAKKTKKKVFAYFTRSYAR